MEAKDLTPAQQLVGEAGQLANAIDIFYTEGSRINLLGIIGPPDQMPAMAAQVNALGMDFGPVLGEIETMLWTQYQSVTSQLDGMGITGYPAPGGSRSAPAAATAKRKR